MTQPLLSVKNLGVSFIAGDVQLPLIRDVSFSLAGKRCMAIVGSSGSGKTTLIRALTNLFPRESEVCLEGEVKLLGKDILACGEKTLRNIRTSIVRYIFQDPTLSLNPIATIERQMRIAAEKHTEQNAAWDLLHKVGLQAEEVIYRYPFQLSVGMAQRVMIAIALLSRPKLLIADEPTSALDPSLRRQLLELLVSLGQQLDMAMILVTHDIGVARLYADDVAVLQDGTLVEQAPADLLFRSPQHPYSRQLIEAACDVHPQLRSILSC